jgi:hypothetical protein
VTAGEGAGTNPRAKLLAIAREGEQLFYGTPAAIQRPRSAEHLAGHGASLSPAEMAYYQRWPTAKLWHTPSTMDDIPRFDKRIDRKKDGTLAHRSKPVPNLAAQIEMWPTPKAMDAEIGANPRRIALLREGQSTFKSDKSGVSAGIQGLEDHVMARDEGLWQTPTTMDSLPPRPQETVARQFEKARKGRTYATVNLREQVHWGKKPSTEDVLQGRLWPTPRSFDADTKSTPNAQKHRLEFGDLMLTDAVKAWEEGEPGDLKAARAALLTSSTPSPETGSGQSSEPSSPSQAGGQLNPTWVEWLMGFPLGWTASGVSAMPSSRKSRSGSVDSSSKGKKTSKPKATVLEEFHE